MAKNRVQGDPKIYLTKDGADLKFIAGQPVVGFEAQRCFSRPTDELIVIGILIGMQADIRNDPRKQQRKDECCLGPGLSRPTESGVQGDARQHEQRWEDEHKGNENC